MSLVSGVMNRAARITRATREGVNEARDMAAVGRQEVAAHIAQRFHKLPTNGEIYVHTRNDPVVHLTGYTAPRGFNLALKRQQKSEGVGLYLANTGIGHNPKATNASNLERSVERSVDEAVEALARSGASKAEIEAARADIRVHLVNHSKGGEDAFEFLVRLVDRIDAGTKPGAGTAGALDAARATASLHRIKSWTTLGTPHYGGTHLPDIVAEPMRRHAPGVTSRVPFLKAGAELLPMSRAEIYHKQKQLQRVLDAAADDFVMYAIASPGDKLVRMDSALLKGFEHPKLQRTLLEKGSHAALHLHKDVQEHMRRTYTKNADLTADYRRRLELAADDPVDPQGIFRGSVFAS